MMIELSSANDWWSGAKIFAAGSNPCSQPPIASYALRGNLQRLISVLIENILGLRALVISLGNQRCVDVSHI